MKVYLFAQALDNDSSDDWYEYTNNSLKEIIEESDQSQLNNLIFELTNEGKREITNNVECYYKLTYNNFLNFILLIENQQKDKIGRVAKTALIIKDYNNIALDFEKILTLFWTRTNRNLVTSISLGKQCDKIFDMIKKKREKQRWLVSLALVSFSIILVLFFLKLRQG
ncbi:hypothetical protein [Acinetobacter baumannii]|uniref:Uncharacterized protein n=1 Tax=Acinetobacter baumannii (strain AB307-0294) TaxID=557600 RepID=A0A5K6CLZ8_ACIB3|nr:hypothetical protein [Acinetobacter baumannii]ATY42685.1 hypothetical protein ABBFA_00211 [Acinetobacter baumannii AB307-0294]